MPRTLPWAVKVSEASNDSFSRRAIRSDGRGVGGWNKGGVSSRPKQRSPPSSPPPPPPPEVGFLREDGEDDLWVMVEDELLSTAQAFTRHLHHAEYLRLKRLAAERALDDFDPRNSDEIMFKYRRKRQKQDDAIEKSEEFVKREQATPSESDEDGRGLNIREGHLAGLMHSTPQKVKQEQFRLQHLQSPTVRTRVAAGYGRQHPNTKDQSPRRLMTSPSLRPKRQPRLPVRGLSFSDEDGLDAGVQQNSKCKASSRGQSTIDAPIKLAKRDDVKREPGKVGGRAETHYEQGCRFKELRNPRTSSSSLAAWRKARDARKKDEEKGKSTVSVDEIPTFLA